MKSDGFWTPLRLRRLLTNPPTWALRLLAAELLWPVLALLAAAYRRTVLRKTPVVTVIGSFGKTTTLVAVTAVLCPGAPRARGNSRSALALAVLAHRPGRPLVVEVGINGPRQMRGYGRLFRPRVVVVTAIGSEHRTSLGDLETTAREKGEMIAALAPGGVVIANGDDERVLRMAAARPPGRRCVTYGWGAENDVRGEEASLEWPGGTSLTVVAPGLRQPVRVALIGPQAARAALAAVAVGLEFGVAPALIAERLGAVRPISGRMQPVPLASGAVILRDDFKSAVETVDSALDVFATVPARRRFVVLGAIAEPEEAVTQLNLRLGRRVAEVADGLITCGAAESLPRGARRGGLAPAAVRKLHGVHEVAAALGEELGPGDVVLLKGRGEQRLGRIALLLAGTPVRCRLTACYARGLACERCPRL